jgi:integrase
MTVYPERRKGTKDFTGYWLVEVTRSGKKTRKRVHTYEDAVEAEAYLKGAEAPHNPREVMTVGRLDAAKLWRGTKDELRSGRRWHEVLKLLGRHTPLAAVRKPQLEDIVDRLRSRGLGPKTINRYLATVSRGLRWAHEADLIVGMPAIPWQREPAGRKVWLPEHHLGPFLEHIRTHAGGSCAFGAEVLLLTGMRVTELLTLRPEDILGDIVHLHLTKTDAPRSIPLPEGYGDRLRAWTRPSYRKLLESVGAASEAVCEFRLTPHGLRHTTATWLTARGVSPLTVAQLLGHKSLATTRQYTHHSVDSLRGAMATLMQGNVGAMPDIDARPLRAASRRIGGLGGNRTPVQGFAVLEPNKDKPE